jgi:hypothetical protein
VPLAVAGLALLGVSSGILLVVVDFWMFRTLQLMFAAEAIVATDLTVMGSGHMM